jgi:hypothetical protein
MGCDYYTYYKVCVRHGENEDVEEYILEETREPHYFFECSERDEDFEEEEDYQIRRRAYYDNQIIEARVRHTQKVIYDEGKWLCMTSAIEKYRTILAKLNVAESDVVSIWKQGGAEKVRTVY